MGLGNFRLLTSACSTVCFYPISQSAKKQTPPPKKTNIYKKSKKTCHPIPSTCSVGSRNISVSGGPTPAQKVSNLQVFFLVIFNYPECFCLAIRRLSDLFIYLFIYLFNFNFLWAFQLRYMTIMDKQIKNILPKEKNSKDTETMSSNINQTEYFKISNESYTNK